MKAKLCIAAAALLALAACGGGGGDDNSSAQDATVPASALASLGSFTSWLGNRPASDVKEPLMMNSAQPPTSDTEEPVDID